MTPSLERLSAAIGYRFADASLLELALSHRSTGSHNNERLEFLGDSVLNFVISGELYRLFSEVDEGRLSRLRASLVKGETLSQLARELSLGDYLRLGSGELKSGGFRRDSILADAFEAILGAVYLDAGLETVQGLILRLFAKRLAAVDPTTALKDPKTRLQEYLQSRQLPLPVYEVGEISGKAHAQTFTVSCSVSGLDGVISASGSSRRKAEQAAAKIALERLNCE